MFNFSEDTLPRIFPNSKRQIANIALVRENENKVSKVEPKKSFRQWQQEHADIFSASCPSSMVVETKGPRAIGLAHKMRNCICLDKLEDQQVGILPMRNQQLTNDTLLKMVTERHEYIMMQQIQILVQQKESLMLRNQMSLLQNKMQQLLQLQKAKHEKKSECNFRQYGTSSSFDEQNDLKTSIGVMTSSYMGNLNHAAADDEIFTESDEIGTHNKTMGSFQTTTYNTTSYRYNDCVAISKQDDLSMSSQTMICKTSTTRNSYLNGQETLDRSFALYMLGMKYCPEDYTF